MSFFLKLFKIIPTFIFLFPFSAFSFRVGLVLDKGGKDDKSFNSAAYQGAMRAKKELGIELKYVEATDFIVIEQFLRSFAKKNYDLIISIGFAQTDAIQKIAKKFPHNKFIIVDGSVDLPNVTSLLFQEHEGSFLVGALAALKSQTHKIGFIGGMDIPLIRRFQKGYGAGIHELDPKAKLTSNFIGVTGEAWNNPAKAKELALSQYSSGVDIIFVAAGASGNGVFDAAEETKKLAIGVDSNQNWVKPGFILTSMLKRVDNAVFDSIQKAMQNKLQAGIVRYGLESGGVDYSLDEFNQKLVTPEMQKKLREIKEKIISGKIIVPDYYLKK